MHAGAHVSACVHTCTRTHTHEGRESSKKWLFSSYLKIKDLLNCFTNPQSSWIVPFLQISPRKIREPFVFLRDSLSMAAGSSYGDWLCLAYAKHRLLLSSTRLSWAPYVLHTAVVIRKEIHEYQLRAYFLFWTLPTLGSLPHAMKSPGKERDAWAPSSCPILAWGVGVMWKRQVSEMLTLGSVLL